MARAMKDSGNKRLGCIPATWEVKKLKYVAQLYTGNSIKDDEKERYEDPVDAVPYLSSKDIAVTFLTADYENGMYVKKDDASFKFAPAGSTLMCIEGGSAGRKKTKLKHQVAFVNKLCCFNPTSVDNSFLFYWLCSPNFEDEFKQNITGLIGGVSISVLQNMETAIPPLDEQACIVHYLDTECARIDAVMEQTRASIEEYKKLKQSIITEAVTKGIRPSRPMKDSGIDWIGQIPAEWNVQRIKTVFTLRDERNYLPLEEVNLISLYTDKGVVQHADLEQTTGNKASNADGYKKVYPNDIVVNIILCWMGAIGRSDYEGVTSPAYDIYIPSEMIDSRYYHHYFRTQGFSGECYKRGKGIMAMRWRTYSDQFRDIPVLVPPIEEQKEILRYLDDTSNKMDTLITKKEQFLSEMESYKKSLIFEYVTGKKEV